MNKIKGDLIKLAQAGEFDVIIHGCNCFCTMGAGFAKTIKEKFPKAFEADAKTESGDRTKLGTINWIESKTETGNLIVVNGYTQYNFKGTGRKAIYEAIRSVFQEVKKEFPGKKIAYPAIGAGLAGGDWGIISKIIEEELKNEDHTFVDYKD